MSGRCVLSTAGVPAAPVTMVMRSCVRPLGIVLQWRVVSGEWWEVGVNAKLLLGLAEGGVNGVEVRGVLGAAGQGYLALVVLDGVCAPREDHIVLARARVEEYEHGSLPVIRARPRPGAHIVFRTC